MEATGVLTEATPVTFAHGEGCTAEVADAAELQRAHGSSGNKARRAPRANQAHSGTRRVMADFADLSSSREVVNNVEDGLSTAATADGF